MTEYTIGQKLWYVPSQHNRRQDGYEVTIARIGRKWLTTDRGLQLDSETLVANGGRYSSPGEAYLTRAVFEVAQMQEKAWGVFQAAMRETYRRPKHLSTEQIERMTAMLRPVSEAATELPATPAGYGEVAYVMIPRSTLQAAVLALRSYEHGNAAPALAKEVADLIEGMIGYAPAAVRS